MTRKDSEKDSDRPHYYSQFWLDVAAGRKIIGAPKPEEGNDHAEVEMPEAISTAHRGGRATASPISDGHRETPPRSVVEPEPVAEEYGEPEENEFEQVPDLDDQEIPNIDVDETLDEEELPSFDEEPDLAAEEEEEPLDEDEEFFEEEDEDEDDEWSLRGRKKPKPGRQQKPPKPTKKPKRGGRF